MGDKFGMTAAVLKPRKFINPHNTATATIPEAEDLDEAWEFEHLTRPEPYDETELPQGLSAQQKDMRRKKQEAVRNKDIVQYDIIEAYQTHYKDAIAQAYNETYIEAIWDNLLGFTHITVAGMLKHLTEKCLTLSFKEKRRS